MLQYNPTVSGSLTITGSLTVTNGVIGTVSGVDVQIFSSSINQVITGIQSSTESSDARLSNIESKSASVDTSISNINSFTASNGTTSLNSKTGSYATTGSNSFYGTQVFSGSVFIANDLIVQGSSSIQYISASSVSIGTNIVQLNTDTPAVRFAGLTVQDSGSSAGVTGSMLWDSLCNRWIYSNPSTIGYSGGMLLSGPRTQTLGTEPTLTCNFIAKSGGGDHLYDSCIIDDGTTTCIKNNLVGTSATFSSSVNIGTAGIEKLNIFGSGSQFINVKNTTSNADMFVGMSSALSAAFIGTGGTDPIVFSTAGTEKMRINSCGNVGINVYCPANLLHLAGASATPSLRLGSISTGFHWDIGRENVTTGDFLFNNANGGATSERLRITVGGNVGIGVICAPATRLTVYAGSGPISCTNDAIRLQVQSYLDAARNTIVWAQDSSNTVLARFGLEWNFSAAQMNFIWRDIYNSVVGCTELMRLTGGGNLLVGATSNASGTPTFYVQNKAGAVANIAGWNFGGTTSSENGNNNLLSSGAYYNGSALIATQTTATNYQQYSGTHVWYTNSGLTAGSSFSNTERMRINAAGGVRIGNPTAFNEDIRFNVYGTGVWDGANIGLQNGGTGGKDWIIFSTMCAFGQGAGNLLFYNNSGPTANGLIIYANGNYDFGGSDVSDARLKQDIENLNYGVNEIMQLSPKSYNLKSEDNLQQENQTVLRKRYGFIAQEVQSILPDTITGQETETDYLGLDYNGVLAVAVKAIQELKAENDIFKTCLGIS